MWWIVLCIIVPAAALVAAVVTRPVHFESYLRRWAAAHRDYGVTRDFLWINDWVDSTFERPMVMTETKNLVFITVAVVRIPNATIPIMVFIGALGQWYMVPNALPMH